MELSLVDYDMIHFPPSQIAAAAFCLSNKILDEGEWVSNRAWSHVPELPGNWDKNEGAKGVILKCSIFKDKSNHCGSCVQKLELNKHGSQELT